MGALSQLNQGCAALRDSTLGNRINKLMKAFLYHCPSKAGLAIGTTKSQVKITNTTTFVNNGVVLSKTTADVAFTATTHDIAGHATLVKEACYLMSLAANGTPKLTMGSIATGAGKAVVPATPSGETAIGYVRIAVAANATPATFDATTTELDAAGFTVTYVDLCVNNTDDLLTALT